MREYKYNPRTGIGGMKCTCCAPYHNGRSLKATKQFVNRHSRRREKINLNKELAA